MSIRQQGNGEDCEVDVGYSASRQNRSSRVLDSDVYFYSDDILRGRASIIGTPLNGIFDHMKICSPGISIM